MMEEKEILAKANERFDVPEGHIHLRYFDDVDLLFIRYKQEPPARSKYDHETHTIYNRDMRGNLISVEILDFTEKFVERGDE